VSKDGLSARVTIDDDALTSEQAHTLHQLITDPNCHIVTALHALSNLAKETNLKKLSMGNICIFEGSTVKNELLYSHHQEYLDKILK